MKTNCALIRDLLPLYADEVCSAESRGLVEEHLQECPDCRDYLGKLKNASLETDLSVQKDLVLRDAARRFRRRTAAVGSAVSGAFMVPVLVCLIINFILGPSLDWVSVALAALCVAASLILVPIFVTENRMFWTFCAFCASLMLLLGVTCLFTKGHWFGLVSSCVLFGLSLVFLPFLIRARPLRSLVYGHNEKLIVVGVDAALLINMLNMIRLNGRTTLSSLLFSLVIFVGIVLVFVELYRHAGIKK